MIIEFNSFSNEYVKTPKGGYNKGLVEYTNEKGYPAKFTLMDFANKNVYKVVKDAKQGDKFDVTITKNGDFNQWAAISPLGADASTGGSPAAGTESSSPPRTGTTGKVLGSTYETREERIARQRLIVRQSSLSNAIEMLTTGAKSPPEYNAVIEMAENLCEWVYEPAPVLHDTESDGVAL